MQTFIDTKTQQVWQFEDDVVVLDTAGVYSFTAAHGVVLNVPVTLQPYVIPAPTPTQLLATAQSAQSSLITAACVAAITNGIPSSALGSAYTYPTKSTDQVNLTANVVGSLMPAARVAGWTTPQMCMNSSGVWAYVPHTTAQIQQVGNDVKTAIAAALVKKNNLLGQVAAATTVTSVEAVIW